MGEYSGRCPQHPPSKYTLLSLSDRGCGGKGEEEQGREEGREGSGRERRKVQGGGGEGGEDTHTHTHTHTHTLTCREAGRRGRQAAGESAMAAGDR